MICNSKVKRAVKSRLLFVGKLAITAAILVYVIYKYVDWPTLKVQISQCNWTWLFTFGSY
jgi:hypothetical protein